MVKKIKIDFPELGKWLKIEEDFGPGLNLLEKPNGYGKTTLAKTLLSLYTGKFGTAKIPNGTATVIVGDDTFILNKGLWVGMKRELSPIAKYVMAGEFFNLDTPKQRLAIVELLDLDYDGYMKAQFPEWGPKFETELKKTINYNAGAQEVILKDIAALRAKIIAYEKNPVVVVNNTQEIESKYAESVADAVGKYNSAIRHNDDVRRRNAERFSNINDIELKIADCLEKYEKQKAVDTCSSCGQKLDEASKAKSLEEIVERGKALRASLLVAKSVKELEPVPVPEPLKTLTVAEKSEAVGTPLTVTSLEEMARKSEYENAKKELSIKEKSLKDIGENEAVATLEAVKKAKRQFTESLNVKVKSLGLEIELFKVQKDEELVESFVISKDGVPYSDLSNGNRTVLQFLMAKAFAKGLDIPFVIVDEAGTLSTESVEEIKKASEDMQVLFLRASPFAKKDLK